MTTAHLSRALIVVASIVLAVSASFPSVALAADKNPPSLVALPAIGKAGTPISITLRDWPAAATVQISTCGNYAINGNADCDNSTSVTAVTNPSGSWAGPAVLGKPPKPCPCVIHAFSTSLVRAIDFPIDLVGYPTAPTVSETGTRVMEIASEVEGGGPLASWFGGAAQRELILTLTNTGTLPLENPPTTVTLGKGQDPTELLTLPRLGSIAPGQTTEVRIPFELPAWSFGSYTVKTTVAGLDQPTAARSSASTYPWFLLVIGWLLLQIPLLGLNKKRRPEPGDTDPGDLIELDDPFRNLVPAGAAAAALAAPVVPSRSASAAPTAGVPDWATVATGLTAAAVGAGATTALLERPVETSVDPAVPAWAATAVAEPAPLPTTPAGAPSAVAAVAAAMAGGAVAGVMATSNGDGPSSYGVSHLRGYVDPQAAPVAPSAVAARVVVGGVNPPRG